MTKNLVIVESPTKSKTIEKFLGKTYTVRASMGHLRDLPKSTFGVDIENNFEPKYINIRGKGDLIKELKSLAKKADKVFLATDPDREGEAISWHLANLLDIEPEKKCRIEFHEITSAAIKDALKNPRPIDMEKVDAQQARRIIDRIVGYKLSPLLWRKIRKGLSAGRVQSVAVKIIAEIIDDVRKNGDAALKAYCEKFDGAKLDSLAVTQQELEEAFQSVDPEFIKVLELAAENIRAFHQRQVRNSFVINEKEGIVTGQKVIPIEKVGLYVPGGTAAYPSTVLMDSIPAKIAGCPEVVMVTPPGSDGKINPVILAAAQIVLLIGFALAKYIYHIEIKEKLLYKVKTVSDELNFEQGKAFEVLSVPCVVVENDGEIIWHNDSFKKTFKILR